MPIDNMRTIAGVALEILRAPHPVPHWRVRVIQTGYMFGSGVFPGKTRHAVWAQVERTAQIVGAERFKREAYECYDSMPCSATDQSECDEKCQRLPAKATGTED